MVTSSAPDTAVLDGAAFGSAPAAWPLPEVASPPQRWLRAVVLGGQGRYAAAHAELAAVLRTPETPRWLSSLCLSTRASLLRQLGWHPVARGFDGRAWALAGTDPDARADAVIGLAADALGLGRFALADTLLDRVVPDGGRWPWRTPLRLAWVRAELAMVSGAGEVSLRHARRAEELARSVPSRRHQVKTGMVLAAALSSAGQPDESGDVAAAALRAAGEHGLTPLRWALAAMLSGMGDDGARREMVALRRKCAVWISDAGGQWRTEATD